MKRPKASNVIGSGKVLTEKQLRKAIQKYAEEFESYSNHLELQIKELKGQLEGVTKEATRLLLKYEPEEYKKKPI